jgi:hypothetical protein
VHAEPEQVALPGREPEPPVVAVALAEHGAATDSLPSVYPTPLGDLVYVVYGAALHFGINLDAVVQEIHRSNITKSPAGNGKAVKGPRYEPPAIGYLLQ